MENLNLEFEVVKNVTVPLLKISDDGQPIYVKILSAIFKARDITGRAPRAVKDGEPAPMRMEAPELVFVVNLKTGEEQQIIVNSVLGSNLREAYPNDSYVAKCCEIKKHKVAGGKRYATFSIREVAVKKSGTVPPATPAAHNQAP